VESQANFILFRAPGEPLLREKMLRRGLLIRASSGFYGLSGEHYRIAVRTEAENGELIRALAEELASGD
jgi:threonine-phosphate decarboxylase